jgi:hypothetical protein
MSALTYNTDVLAPVAPAAKAASPRRSFWKAVYDGMLASRERRAEREIAAYIEGHGGVLNDEMEREIMRRINKRRAY